MSREENDRMLRAMLQRAMTGMKRRRESGGVVGAEAGREEAVGQGEGAASAVPNGVLGEGKLSNLSLGWDSMRSLLDCN